MPFLGRGQGALDSNEVQLANGENEVARPPQRDQGEPQTKRSKTKRLRPISFIVGQSWEARQNDEYVVDSDISRGREINKIPALSYRQNDEAPNDYHYVTKYVHQESIRINTSLSNMYICSCKDDCNDGSCLCSSSQIHGRCYNSKGRLNRDYNFLMPEVIYECNVGCKCNYKACRNTVIQLGSTGKFALFRTKTRGWGVRTLTNLKQGSFVGVYSGELVSSADSFGRPDDTYLFNLNSSGNINQQPATNTSDQLKVEENEEVAEEPESEPKPSEEARRSKANDSFVCDAKRYGNFTRFINHSCEPNVIGIRSYTEHQDTRFPYIAFFTNTFVAANSELTLNYGDNYWLIKCKRDSVHCLCKKPSCRFSKRTFPATYKRYKEQKAARQNGKCE